MVRLIVVTQTDDIPYGQMTDEPDTLGAISCVLYFDFISGAHPSHLFGSANVVHSTLLAVHTRAHSTYICIEYLPFFFNFRSSTGARMRLQHQHSDPPYPFPWIHCNLQLLINLHILFLVFSWLLRAEHLRLMPSMHIRLTLCYSSWIWENSISVAKTNGPAGMCGTIGIPKSDHGTCSTFSEEADRSIHGRI